MQGDGEIPELHVTLCSFSMSDEGVELQIVGIRGVVESLLD